MLIIYHLGLCRKKKDITEIQNIINEELDSSFDFENDKIYYGIYINDVSDRRWGYERYVIKKMDLNGENKEVIELPMIDFSEPIRTATSFEVEGKMMCLRLSKWKDPVQYEIYRINLETKETKLLSKVGIGTHNPHIITENGIYFMRNDLFYPTNNTKPETRNLRNITSLTGGNTVKFSSISGIFADRGELYYKVGVVDPIKKIPKTLLIKYNEGTKKMFD